MVVIFVLATCSRTREGDFSFEGRGERMGEVGSLRRLDADAGLAPVPPLRVVPEGRGALAWVLSASCPARRPRASTREDSVRRSPPLLLAESPHGWVRAVNSRDRT